jgi:uncharacterized repeat protein (TIGR03803 family)
MRDTRLPLSGAYLGAANCGTQNEDRSVTCISIRSSPGSKMAVCFRGPSVRMPKILHSLAAVFVLLFVNLAWGASEKVLYTFDPADSMPGGLVFDGVGNLYGTTFSGGAFGLGGVFELSPSAGG